MRRGWRFVLLSVLAIAGGAGIVVGGVIAWYMFSGNWNIAASEPHFPPVRWAAERVYHASVDQHAGTSLQASLTDADVAPGGRLYSENCAVCHAAPGGELSAWVDGMAPVPPHLPAEGTGFDAAEVFWILRHGIKMSGMPAWQDVLTDAELMSLTAFVVALPDISPDRYSQMLQAGEEEAASEGDADTAGTTGGSAPAERAQADAGPAATIEMTNALTFEPATITIKVGDTVRWTNPSDIRHTVTADESRANDPAHVVLPDGAEPFHSGEIGPGGSWNHTFTVAGRYQYFCVPHEGGDMIAEIIVEE